MKKVLWKKSPWNGCDSDVTVCSIPERELSQSINGGLGKNFFELVNEYRIDYACNLLAEPREAKQTILEVMYSSGFQSKSSFNTEFRKRTGMTPSAWKRKGSGN
ncbi:MAG: helix-turn-helix domain-containing protein [Lewinella sp.]